MFSSGSNPYDEIIIKATDENLASEDWGLNIEVCDKVGSDGAAGARNAIAALQKRLVHRNPNVQLYALELANTLAQNCGKPVHEELSSRNWTTSLDRLVNDRATNGTIKKKALTYIKAWAKQFEESGDPNLGLMGELYDQLRAKNFIFDEPEPVPEDAADARRRQEEEELARVLELSKQDKGGRTQAFQTYQPSHGSGSRPAQNQNQSQSQSPMQVQQQQQQQPHQQQHHQPQPQQQNPYQSGPSASASVPQIRPDEPLDINTATRVRALYAFASEELGELSFERGDVIKVLDRGFKEWWRGACNGKIGIFPVTYVEALAEPTASELQEEAQEEAKVFASLGMVDRLLQLLKQIDTSRGERLDSNPEIEELYNESIGLQGQINALIKKYSDQKAELEHMNANFLRAMKQYEDLRAPSQQYFAPQDQYGQAGYSPQPAQQSPYLQQQPQPQSQGYYPQQQPHGAPTAPGPDGYFPQPQPHPAASHSSPQSQPQQQFQRVPSGAPAFPPDEPTRSDSQHAGAAGLGAGASQAVGASDTDAQHRAAWDEYYRQNPQVLAQHQASGQMYGMPAQDQGQGQGQGQEPYPAVAGPGGPHGQHPHPQSQSNGPGAAHGNANGAVAYGQSPYPSDPQQQQHQQQQGQYGYAAHHAGSVDNLAQGVQRMGVQQQ